MSPLDARELTSSSRALVELHADGPALWCVEHDPAAGVFRILRDDVDVTPEGCSAATRVYEYGGCALHVRDGWAWFTDAASQALVERSPDGVTRRLTEPGARRHADPHLDAVRHRLLAVCEDTSVEPEPTAEIVAVDLRTGDVTTLVSGPDFVTSPRVSPDGSRLAYVRWSHPRMPWDEAEVVLADLDEEGRVTRERVVAGGADSSAGAPAFAPDGTLYFVWDRTGWWNVHRLGPDGPEPVHEAAAWSGAPGLNHPDYATDGRQLVLAEHAAGVSTLVRRDLATGEVERLDLPSTLVRHPRLTPDGMAYLGGSGTDPVGLWRWTRKAGPRQLRATATLDPALLAEPERIWVPTRDGARVLIRLWRPTTPAPGPWPTLLHVHGGPVLSSHGAVQLGIYALLVPAYWTSRGYAYADVDYRGTLGYGRGSWQHLYGRWGQVDVTDAEDAALHLVAEGVADPDRLAIRGASAGGWTTAHAITSGTAFRAGTAYFPVADLLAFAGTTHKLESHYIEQLVGPYDEELYRARSPLAATDASGPLLIVQGTDDNVCPPAQAHALADAMTAAGHRSEVVLIEGEGHGFVRAESNTRALETETAFYEEVLGVRRS